MKLSEAMRLGAMLKPQTFGWFTDAAGGTCAMGAATDAAGGHCLQEWSAVLRVSVATCPACGVTVRTGRGTYAGGALIVHLNDNHRWTRERIADWVETVEREREAQLPTDAQVAREALR